MKKQIGMFTIEVSEGGHPAWVQINELRFSHTDLADLEYAVSQAKKAAINYLPEKYKSEV